MTHTRRRSVLPTFLGALAAACLSASCGLDAFDKTSGPEGELTFNAPTTVDTLVADLSIGSESGPAEEAFGNIPDIEVGPDGTIYVLDGSVNTVRVFSPDGKYVRSIGRRGEGPGELTRPRAMALAPDGSLWVYDDGARAVIGGARSPGDPARAVLVLSPDGTEVARHASTSSGVPGGPLTFTWNVAFTNDGRMRQTVQRADRLPTGATGVLESRVRQYVRSLDPATGAVDSVSVSDDLLRRIVYRPADGGVVLGIVPFDARRLVALDSEGNVWNAASTAYTIERRAPAGDTLVVRVEVDAPPFSAEERASWEEQEAERQLGLQLPERSHVLWQLFTDDENRLWVQRAKGFEATGQFEVFSPDGELLGSLFLPGRTSPYATVARAGHLYAVTYDELGVARVIRAPVPFLR